MQQKKKTCKSWIPDPPPAQFVGGAPCRQPLNVLYGLLRGDALPDGEALSHAVTAVLDKGVEIIRLAEEERRKYEDE